MALENYRDLSVSGSDVGAGFQFEFKCERCGRKWKSPFQPYRMGQLAGLLSRFSFLVSSKNTTTRATGNFADMGSRGARDKALGMALEHAGTLYTECQACHEGVCPNCYDEREQACLTCLDKRREPAHAEPHGRYQGGSGASSDAPACPNCRNAMAGGRFCAECGFDMASTHKSCPGCAALIPRPSRFCTDCGHGF